jgi:hypothetical protein
MSSRDIGKNCGNNPKYDTLLLLARLIAKRHRSMKQIAEEGAVDNLSNDATRGSNENLS